MLGSLTVTALKTRASRLIYERGPSALSSSLAKWAEIAKILTLRESNRASLTKLKYPPHIQTWLNYVSWSGVDRVAVTRYRLLYLNLHSLLAYGCTRHRKPNTQHLHK